jgi:hypothetical protein
MKPSKIFVGSRASALLYCGIVCENGEVQIIKANYNLIHMGLKVHFIMASIVEEEGCVVIQPVTITSNHKEVDTIHSISEEQLENFIHELP